MTENSFQPHSDEELARLLEEQMKALRPQSSSAPAQSHVDDVESQPSEDSDNALDELFGALLDDSPSPVQDETAVHQEEKPIVDESVLGLTQPIDYVSVQPEDDLVLNDEINSDVVTSEVTPSTQSDTSDVHAVAERVLQDIDTQGVVVATTIASTASSEPVPGMFGIGPSETDGLEEHESLHVEPITSGQLHHDVAAEFVRRITRQDSGFSSRPLFDDVVFGQDSES